MSVELDGRRQRTAASRTAILDAAARLFGEGGFHATSLRAIATAIGMSHPGVLRHFPTKGALLVAVLQEVDRADDAFTLSAPPDVPREVLVRLLVEHTMQQTAALNLRVMLLGEAGDPSHPAHDYVRTQFGLVERELSAALDSDGVDLLALWNGLQLIWRYVPDLDPVAVAVAQDLSRASRSGSSELPLPPAPAPAGPPDDEPRERQIVAVASQAFARNGYRSTSLRDIAAAMGVSHSALLYHFPSKVALLTAVLEQRDHDESTAWLTGADPLDYLADMVDHAQQSGSSPGLARLFSSLASEAIDSGHPAHSYFADRYRRVHAELEVVLRRLVESGRAHDDVDCSLEAWAVIAQWEGLGLREFYVDAPGDLPRRLHAHLESLLTVKLNHTLITTG